MPGLPCPLRKKDPSFACGNFPCKKLVGISGHWLCCQAINSFFEFTVDCNIQGLNFACSSWWDQGQCGLAFILQDFLDLFRRLCFTWVVYKKPRSFCTCAEEDTLPSRSSFLHHSRCSLEILRQHVGDIVSLLCQEFGFMRCTPSSNTVSCTVHCRFS